MRKPQPPYYGAAYYPEDWPIEQIDADVELMLSAGMNCMRVGEFAWSTMEPEEGDYRFEWLHTVVDKLAAAGIGTILGTPTATPPIWLVDRYPEVLSIDDLGMRTGHGARRHVCPNNSVYRDYCAAIVHRMADEFGRDERILGWQIDNEVYPPNGRSCCCPTCMDGFHAFLRDRFGSIDRLNAAWCLSLWSMEYRSFEQVPPPRRDIWHHPSLLFAWSEFASESYARYVEHQADILHSIVSQPVGTDMMPFEGVDYERMHRRLDLVQFNHYNGVDDLWRAAFWFDFIRPLKPAPFWNTETQTCWNGSVAINAGSKPRRWCRANAWLPIALGGEANLYWLWRQHWAGQEMMHGAVVSSHGRPLQVFEEVAEIGRSLSEAGEFLRLTRPEPSRVALLWSQTVGRMAQWNPVLHDFRYQQAVQDRFYKPLLQAQWRPDVIVPSTDLSAYGLIVCPFLFTLDEAGLRERLHAWVEAGGTLIIGPLSDIRDSELAKYRHAPFGSLEDWAGVHVRHSVPALPDEHPFIWRDGRSGSGAVWLDGLEARDAEVLATYGDGPNSGLAAVTRRKLGTGAIVLLGTAPGSDDVQRLIADAAAGKDLRQTASASPNVVAVPRSGRGMRGLVAVEIEGRPGSIRLPMPARNLLTGDRLTGDADVEPFGVLAATYD